MLELPQYNFEVIYILLTTNTFVECSILLGDQLQNQLDIPRKFIRVVKKNKDHKSSLEIQNVQGYHIININAVREKVPLCNLQQNNFILKSYTSMFRVLGCVLFSVMITFMYVQLENFVIYMFASNCTWN